MYWSTIHLVGYTQTSLIYTTYMIDLHQTLKQSFRLFFFGFNNLIIKNNTVKSVTRCDIVFNKLSSCRRNSCASKYPFSDKYHRRE